MRDFWMMFFVQCLSYFLITMNQRAIAIGLYFWTGITDLAFASINFVIIKRVAKSESNWAWAGYTVGGVVGSLSAIFLTKLLYGE